MRTRTLANLSGWPEAKVEALRRVLRGETFLAPAADRCEIERSLPHGHVAAVLGVLRAIGLDRRIKSMIKSGGLLPRRPERLAKLALALIVARVLEPAAKLATARQLTVLGLGEVGAGAAASAGRHAGALRRHFPLSRGSVLRAGALRLQPRRPA